MSIVTENTPGEMKQFGVYSIIFHSRRGDMVYIGSTAQDFEQRLYEHLSYARRNKHGNKYFQNLWNKYQTFDFKIVEICLDRETVAVREQWHIEKIDRSQLINNRPAKKSNRFQVIISEETRRKQSDAAKIRASNPAERERLRSIRLSQCPISDEARQKISEASKRYMNSPEAKEKYSLLMKGRDRGEEFREKLRKANSGKAPAPQTIEAVRRAHIGKKASDETRRKMSESHKRRFAENPELLAKALCNIRGRVITDETRAKLRKASTGKRHTEETKEKLRQATLAHYTKKREEECIDR
jgi:hypothetical protein